MNAETVARTIQMILAPVVMITACAILLGGLQSRYAAVNDRLRAMAHERLELLRALGVDIGVAAARMGNRSGDARDARDVFAEERLQEVDFQIPDLLRRHKLARDALLAVYCAVLVFVASMFLIAAAVAAGSAWVASGALFLFLGGAGTLLLGTFLAVVEVRTSHCAAQYEVRRVLDLGP